MERHIITPPTTSPISLNQILSQARIDAPTASEVEWITTVVIPTVLNTAQNEAQLSLSTTTMSATVFESCDPGYDPTHNLIRLPRPPVQSITSITASGQTIDPSQYELRTYGLNSFAHLKISPAFPATVVYVAGFTDANPLPASIIGIMLAHAAFLFDNRSADVEPTAIDRVYRRYRSFAQ